jgi:hypothetical protein
VNATEACDRTTRQEKRTTRPQQLLGNVCDMFGRGLARDNPKMTPTFTESFRPFEGGRFSQERRAKHGGDLYGTFTGTFTSAVIFCGRFIRPFQRAGWDFAPPSISSSLLVLHFYLFSCSVALTTDPQWDCRL